MKHAIWIIGGTTEGRCLAKALKGYGVRLYVSVATEYGKALMQQQDNLTIMQGRLQKEEMEDFLHTQSQNSSLTGLTLMHRS